MIPPLTEDGLLPPGIHEASWEELVERFGATPWRRQLIGGLREAARSLAHAGCQALYVDGSFTTGKDYPGDFDGCWDERGVDPTRLDPVLLTFENARAAQKVKYLGELFPASSDAESDPPYRVFLDFFQRDKEGRSKGIISIDLVRYKP